MTALPATPDQAIEEYEKGPYLLEAAVRGLSDADLDVAPSHDEWTIREVVHHVADGDDIWKLFIKQALGNPGGQFVLQWYWQLPQEDWAKRWAYTRRPIGPSLAMFRSNREHTTQLLRHATGAFQNALCVRWPKGPEEFVSIGWVVEMQGRHVRAHVEDISRIREAHRL